MASLQEHQKVLLELLREFDRVCKKHNIRYVLFAGSALGAVRHQGFIPWDDDLDVALLRDDYERLMRLDASEWNEAYYMQCEFSAHWPLHFSKLRKNNTTCLEKYHPRDPQIHQGIYMDVFPCDNASDNPHIRKLQYLASRAVIAKTISKRGYITNSFLKKAFIFCCHFLPLKPLHRFVVRAKDVQSKTVHIFLGGNSKYERGYFDRCLFSETIDAQFEDMTVPIAKDFDALLSRLYGDYMTLPSEEEREVKVHSILVDVEKDYTEYAHYRDGMTFDVLTRSIR